MATLSELQTLLNDPILRDKVRAAVVIAAKNVSFESAATENHANRLKWAKSALSDPNGWAEKFTRFIVGVKSSETLSAIQGLSDTDINDNVSLGINTFADGSN